MLIGVDASRAVKAKRTGTENYSWYLLRELLQQDQKNQYRLYAPHLPANDFGEFANAQWKIIPPGRLWSQLKLASELRHNPPDLLFVPSHVVPLFSSVPSVVTIHGLEYKYYPESYSKFERRYLNTTTATSLKKARVVLVPSTATKRDIVKEYKTSPAKIVVTPLGFDQTLFNTEPGSDRPTESPYIFFIGRIDQRKNLTLLVDAFALLAKEIKDIRLVIAGKPGHGYEVVQSRIDALPSAIRDRVDQVGYLEEDQAAAYMKNAAMFVFPSLYEGFGIPVLEAMACGTPVICSNTSSLPEVAGDGAVLLPPENPLSWAAAMSRVIHQPEHVVSLKSAGLSQSARFSWQCTAKQTLEVLDHAL